MIGMTHLLVTAAVALCYLTFNSMLFLSYDVQLNTRPSKWLSLGLTFIINYLIFIIISILEFSLAANWMLIALVLIVEVHLLYRCRPLLSVFMGLSGAVLGLAVNIISRSSLSIFLDLPLDKFDARLTSPYTSRAQAVGIAFLLGGTLLWTAQPLLKQHKCRYFNRSIINIYFALGLMSVQLGYLLLTLLIYSMSVNELYLKLWGIKTGVCVLLGYSIGLWYAVRESGLEYFEQKNKHTRQKLITYREEEKALKTHAYIDELTGCRSRSYGKKILEERIRQKVDFTLCFVDINGLKNVNDTLGHGQGNRYIILVAHALMDAQKDERDMICRFGGDEFFLLLHNRSLEEVEELLKGISETIESISWTTLYPFQCSISYGIAQRDGKMNSSDLLRLADERMYAHKTRYRANQVAL